MHQEKKINKWIFLSYELQPSLSAYGNGDRLDIESRSLINKGNSSNSSLLRLPSHFGTHIDFPHHFSQSASTGSHYGPEDFIFNHVKLIDISTQSLSDYLIYPRHMDSEKLDPATECLLIKTGFCQYRSTDNYWKKNPGLSPELGNFLTGKMPGLRVIGLDLISISSWQRRDIGRIAHKEFLINQNILIIEDMDLSNVDENTCFEKVIASPLRFHNSDGSPATVFAEIKNED